MFDEFFNGTIRMWIMFTSLKRWHYTSSNNHCNTSFQFAKSKRNPRKLTIMREIFGQRKMKETILPLGFHGEILPDENLRCDLPGCRVESDEQSILEGCSTPDA